MSIIPTTFDDLLQAKTVASVATLGPLGEPHCTPVSFGWDGTYIRFGLAKSRQKYRNLQRDPRVTLLIVDPSRRGRHLEIRGKVVSVEDDSDLHFLTEMAQKYLGKQQPARLPAAGEELVVMVVQPEHVTHQG